MSLGRHFFRELRPLFRLLEEPLGRPYGPASLSAFPHTTSIFNDPFFTNGPSVPAVDVHEDGNVYVVEAELPGVKKENLEVRIGDGGQSLTIEGKTFIREGPKVVEAQAKEPATGATAPAEGSEGTNAVTQSATPTQIASERTFTGQSSFSRTIWLPRRVDGANVTAKLEDGVLTVRVPKAEDSESVKVNVN